MSAIEKKTGIHGTTLSGITRSSKGVTKVEYDRNGKVTRCWFAFTFTPSRTGHSRFSISNGDGHWGARMGNGSLIPLYHPVQISLIDGGDNISAGAIIQFDMHSGYSYPSNSPCTLVKLDSDAEFSYWDAEDVDDSSIIDRSMLPNWGYTIYDGSASNGKTTSCQFTVPIITSASTEDGKVGYDMSISANGWGVLFPNGETANLSSPNLLYKNSDNFIIKFSMDKSYDFDSPCLLVRTSAEAKFTYTDADIEEPFHAVRHLFGIPEVMMTGTVFNLMTVGFDPTNATKKDLSWSLIEGPATLSNGILKAIGPGNIVVQGRVFGGKNSEGEDFIENHTVASEPGMIQITRQPEYHQEFSSGNIDGSIQCEGIITNGIVDYQWYSIPDSNVNNENGTPISGATGSVFKIPALEKGVYYYYCEVSAYDKAVSIKSSVASVSVFVLPTDLTLTVADTTLPAKNYTVNEYTTTDLVFQALPTNTDYPEIDFESSNPELATVSSRGRVTFHKAAIGGSSQVTIYAKLSYDNSIVKSITFNIIGFIPVENVIIKPDTSSVDSTVADGESTDQNAYTLAINVEQKLLYEIIPENATMKGDIRFEAQVQNNTNTDCHYYPHGNEEGHEEGWFIKAQSFGYYGVVGIVCTIPKAIDGVNPYVVYIPFMINKEFVPATRVEYEIANVRAGYKIPLIPLIQGDATIVNEDGVTEHVNATNMFVTDLQIDTSKSAFKNGTIIKQDEDDDGNPTGLFNLNVVSGNPTGNIAIKAWVQNGTQDVNYIDPSTGKKFRKNVNAVLTGYVHVDSEFIPVTDISINASIFPDSIVNIPKGRFIEIPFNVTGSSTPSNNVINNYYKCALTSDGKLPLAPADEDQDEEYMDDGGTVAENSGYIIEESGTNKLRVKASSAGTIDITCHIQNGKSDGDYNADNSVTNTKNDFLKTFNITVLDFIAVSSAMGTFEGVDLSGLSTISLNSTGKLLRCINVSPYNSTARAEDVTFAITDTGGSDVSVWKSSGVWYIKASTASTSKCKLKMTLPGSTAFEKEYSFDITV